jgi:heme-degrading monooxygenase HmoA
MTKLHLAQVNIGRIKAPLEDPAMVGFVSQLDEINALADRSPGFVWRLQTEAGNATYLRPYQDNRLLFNMSVWASLEDLQHYVYHSAHVQVLRRRGDWFEKPAGNHLALWWVPAGHIPSVDEGKKRLAHLEAHGPTPFAFTFSRPFPPDEAVVGATDWSAFEPCPAV